VAGDFNMSLTETPKQLRSCGIICECVAWYPWQRDDISCRNAAINAGISAHRLGFDSCGIFYIGGKVQVIATLVRLSCHRVSRQRMRLVWLETQN
jgi:hypothetical protein